MATTVRTSVTQRPNYEGRAPSPPITLRLRPVIDVTPELLLELSSLNSDLRLELTAEGELIVMTPTGGEAGHRNLALAVQLGNWSERDGRGIAFDSSTGFELKRRSVLSPDASWVLRPRWDALSAAERETYPPLCPDFVVELGSPSDTVRSLQRKMVEWLDNGIRLGWLIDPKSKRVFVYRPDASVEQLDAPKTVSADPVLPGFVLDLTKIW